MIFVQQETELGCVISNVFADQSVYLATVPSLNEVGQNHMVVFQVDENWQLTVYDPQHGRDGKRYYVADKPKNDKECFLTSWSELTKIYRANWLLELTKPVKGREGVNHSVH
jgi:hypothetical protein